MRSGHARLRARAALSSIIVACSSGGGGTRTRVQRLAVACTAAECCEGTLHRGLRARLRASRSQRVRSAARLLPGALRRQRRRVRRVQQGR